MENALDKALANASLNARMNGDTLHTENLDSIADPTFDEQPDLPNIRTGEVHTVYNKDGISYVKPSESIPRPVLNYQQMMEAEYAEKVAASNTTTSSIHHLSVLTQVISDKTNQIQQQLTDVYVQLSRIEATITSAAQSMSSTPNFKHRSLDQWDDSQLLNELVERENDLMPFYFELLKRIPRELQPHVDESMKGKYQSLGVLSKLCAALSYVQQPQQQEYVINGNFNDTHLNAPNYAQTQQMSGIIQQLNQPSADDLARASRNPDKYGSPTYPQSDNQPTILNEYRTVPKLPFVNGMINPYPQG